MKHGAHNHMKMGRLMRRLDIDRPHAVGLVHLLWHATIENALAGDIGRISNEEIADFCEWKDDPEKLVAAFVSAGWIDRCADHRLVIHDWADHAENWVKKRARDRGVTLLRRGVEQPSNEGSTVVQQKSSLVTSLARSLEKSHTLTPPTKPSPPKPYQALSGDHADACENAPPLAAEPIPIDKPGYAEATEALSRWKHSGGGVPLNPAQGEPQTAWRAFDDWGDSPPIVRHGEPVRPVVLVPLAVEALIAKRVKFKTVKFALGCVRAQLDEWRLSGIGPPAAPTRNGAATAPPGASGSKTMRGAH